MKSLIFFFLIIVVVYSTNNLFIPLKKIGVPLQGISTKKLNISNQYIKKLSRVKLSNLIKSHYIFPKFFVTLQSSQKTKFLISLSTKFSGLWFKDPKCYDCSLIKNTPKCVYNCISDKNFQQIFNCSNCSSISKKYLIPELKTRIKKSKYVYSDLIINRYYESFISLNKYPIILALETVNIKLVNGDGQLGLKSDKKKLDFLSILAEKKLISKESFSIYFNINDNKTYCSSYLQLGGYKNENFLERELKFISFSSKDFSFLIESIKFGNERTITIENDKYSSFIDLDNNFMGFPDKIFDRLIEFLVIKMKGKCDFISSLVFCSFSTFQNNQKLSLFFSKNINLSIPIQRLVNCQSIPEYKIANYCLLNIKKTKDFILGAPFFQEFYAFFDFSTNQIGFARLNLKNQNNFLNPLKFNENSEETDWEALFYLASVVILILIVILSILLKRRVYNYSSIKPIENSLMINDGVSLNNESFIGCDSFNLEYEMTDSKKKTQEEIVLEEKITPIARKYLIDQHHKEFSKKDENEVKEIQEIEGIELEKTIKKERLVEKNKKQECEFKSLTEENEGNNDNENQIDEQKEEKIEIKEENEYIKDNNKSKNEINFEDSDGFKQMNEENESKTELNTENNENIIGEEKNKEV